MPMPPRLNVKPVALSTSEKGVARRSPRPAGSSKGPVCSSPTVLKNQRLSKTICQSFGAHFFQAKSHARMRLQAICRADKILNKTGSSPSKKNALTAIEIVTTPARLLAGPRLIGEKRQAAIVRRVCTGSCRESSGARAQHPKRERQARHPEQRRKRHQPGHIAAVVAHAGCQHIAARGCRQGRENQQNRGLIGR